MKEKTSDESKINQNVIHRCLRPLPGRFLWRVVSKSCREPCGYSVRSVDENPFQSQLAELWNQLFYIFRFRQGPHKQWYHSCLSEGPQSCFIKNIFPEQVFAFLLLLIFRLFSVQKDSCNNRVFWFNKKTWHAF